MKKGILFAILIAMIAVLSACNSKNETHSGPGVTIMTDSVVCVIGEPITTPRYGCNGKVLEHPKLLGMDYVNTVIPPKEKVIPDSLLRAKGYEYTGEYPKSIKPISTPGFESGKKRERVTGLSTFPWPTDVLKGLIVLAAVIALLLLLVWLLSNIAAALWNNRPRFKDEKILPLSPQPPLSGRQMRQMSVDLENQKNAWNKEAAEHSLSILKELAKTGGYAYSNNDGFIYEFLIDKNNSSSQEKKE